MIAIRNREIRIMRPVTASGFRSINFIEVLNELMRGLNVFLISTHPPDPFDPGVRPELFLLNGPLTGAFLGEVSAAMISLQFDPGVKIGIHDINNQVPQNIYDGHQKSEAHYGVPVQTEDGLGRPSAETRPIEYRFR